MDHYLAVDFGSTYTKTSLINIVREEIVATGISYTTVETDVNIGYKKSKENLFKKIKGCKDINIIDTLACSSAGGGLKIIAIGLIPDLTSEAAKRAALGAGARVIKTYSNKLNMGEIEEIKFSDVDIILLAGGTDGGNEECILHNARLLSQSNINIPLVVGGNKSCQDEILSLFSGKESKIHISENVMPKLNEINVEPVREEIRKIFMKRIVIAKGIGRIERAISRVLMPTPAAVLKAGELLSLGTKDEEGIGDLIVVDIGGATTDIHSIGEGAPSNSSVILKGLPEPIAKRTVEGDLGMRYSALSLYEASGNLKLKEYIEIKDYNLYEEFKKRAENPDFLGLDEKDRNFDEGMGKLCVDIGMARHAGKIENIYTPLGGSRFSQKGKDLLNTPYIIGTGGVLNNSKNPKDILKAGFYTEDEPNILKPRNPKILIDKKYIFSALGLLSSVDKNLSLRMLKKYIGNWG